MLSSSTDPAHGFSSLSARSFFSRWSGGWIELLAVALVLGGSFRACAKSGPVSGVLTSDSDLTGFHRWTQSEEQRSKLVKSETWRRPATAEERFRAAKRLAELGDPEGDAVVGWMYAVGEGVGRNWAEAASHLRRAADQSVPLAQVYYGLMLAQGVHGTTNRDEAFRWFKAAAAQGFPMGEFVLGMALQDGCGTPINHAEAVQHYDRSDAAGCMPATSNLGFMYEQGLGVARDPARALGLYRRAAAAGYSPAMRHLGSLYSKGDGVPRDLGEAAKHFQRAAVLGDPESAYRYGRMLLLGRGVPPNESEAAKWLRTSAKDGHPDARALVSEMVLGGKLPGDRPAAAREALATADAGSLMGQRLAGILCAGMVGNFKGLVPRNHPQAVAYLRAPAEAGDRESQGHLGYLLWQGELVPPDPPEAYKWLYLAAQQKLSQAVKQLPRMRSGMTEADLQEGKNRVETYRTAHGNAGPQAEFGPSDD